MVDKEAEECFRFVPLSVKGLHTSRALRIVFTFTFQSI